MEGLFHAMREYLHDAHTYVVSIGVGLIAKISYDLYMKRTLSFIQWVAVIALSVVCGYLTSAYCISYGKHELSQILVPLATLFGEKVVQYVMENYKTILGNIVGLFKRK